jgi:hypothetical protein
MSTKYHPSSSNSSKPSASMSLLLLFGIQALQTLIFDEFPTFYSTLILLLGRPSSCDDAHSISDVSSCVSLSSCCCRILIICWASGSMQDIVQKGVGSGVFRTGTASIPTDDLAAARRCISSRICVDCRLHRIQSHRR